MQKRKRQHSCMLYIQILAIVVSIDRQAKDIARPSHVIEKVRQYKQEIMI